MSEKKLEKVLYVRVSNEMHKALTRLAEEDGRSVGSLVRQVFKQYFKKQIALAEVHTKKR